MINAVVYARYSSTNQREESIDGPNRTHSRRLLFGNWIALPGTGMIPRFIETP